MPRILAIDFGTTNCRMAVMDGGETILIENSEGARATPSVVGFTKTGERLVGQAAKRQAITNPQNTVSSVKRFMGRKFEEVQADLQRVPYKVVRASNGDAYIQITVGGQIKIYSPPEISAMILSKLKADAEAKFGQKITDAVITVPACFNDSQRNATKDAGKIAGLNVLRICNETTAASVAYGLDKKHDEKIAVYDLGGGTFDISVLQIGDGVFEVKATNGDTHLGGDDWDKAIMDWMFKEFRAEMGIDLTKQPDAVQRIKEEAENAKIALSSSQRYDINLPFITADQTGPKHIQKTITRSNFEQLTNPLLERTLDPVRNCLKDANLSGKEIDQLILVGGMTRMPKVMETARRLFGKALQNGVNPEEVVAIGAAILGGALRGNVKDVLLLDVTPLTLAIETAGGVATGMIPRNTTLPTRKTQIFSTYADNQPGVEIKVLQGERPLSRDNKQLGVFHLDGIPPAPRGVPQIEVTFDVDANGILHVSAKDLGTGKQQQISISGSSGLTKEEVERMCHEAATQNEQDQRAKDNVDARNSADTLAYACEKQVKELEERISAQQKQWIWAGIGSVRDALKTDDIIAIKRAYEKLKENFQQVSDDLSRQADDVAKSADMVDAEFEVVDEAERKGPGRAKATSSGITESANAPTIERNRPLRLFVSYSHADEAFNSTLLEIFLAFFPTTRQTFRQINPHLRRHASLLKHSPNKK